jgi:polyisoprenoid-binding protein YceI
MVRVEGNGRSDTPGFFGREHADLRASVSSSVPAHMGETLKALHVLFAFVVIGLSLAPSARAKVYTIDPDHSSVTLSATHLGVGAVQGRFDKFAGTFEFDPANIGASNVHVRIDASSINTNQSARDEHLRSAEFLDADKYPEITFESTAVTGLKLNQLRIAGNLTLHGVTNPVVLLAKLGGATKDMDGKNRVAFATSTDIRRKDYHIDFNQMVGVSMVVGQIVQIYLNVEGVELTEGSPK